MEIYEILFSPTGGTAKVSSEFTRNFGESVVIDLTDRNLDFSALKFSSEDICVVSVPSYGGRVPETAVLRLRQIKGNGAKAVLIAVYGNRAYEDTLIELRDELTECGFCCIAGVSAVAEHSIMHRFAAGRPNERDIAELADFAAEIKDKVGTENGLKLQGNRPYKERKKGAMNPQTDETCVKCGICAEKCPVGAIPADNPMITDSEKCIGCMRCISVCPTKAKSLNEELLNGLVERLKDACSGYKKNELFV